MTRVSELEGWLNQKGRKEIVRDELLGSARVEAQKFKAVVKQIFYMHHETGLYTLKFHLLEHVVEDLDRFWTLEFSNSSTFEPFNITQAYWPTSKRRGSALEKLLRALDARKLEMKKEGLVALRKEKRCSFVEKRDQICRTGPFLVQNEGTTSLCIEKGCEKGKGCWK